MMFNRGMPKRQKTNNSKITEHGITFDSKLENYLYNLFKEHQIDFEFQKEFILQDGFKYRYESILPIKIRIDFFLPQHNLVVDTKGFQLADGKLKYKMLKMMFHALGTEYRIEMPSSQKKCRELIESIKRGYFLVEEPISEAVGKSRKKALTALGFEWREGRWGRKGWIYDAGFLMSLHNYDFQELIKDK